MVKKLMINSGACVEHAFFRSLAFFTERNQNLTKAEREKAISVPNLCSISRETENLPNAKNAVLNDSSFAL